MGFFRQIRERRLFQITATYGAAGWVAVQVVNDIVDRGVLPEVAFRLALVWYVAGVLATLVIGWYHGEKGRQDVPRTEVAFLGVVAVAALGVTGRTVSGYLATARAKDLAVAASQGALDTRSIAVLYFEDGSGTDSLAYLADGLTEALIADLSAVPSLHVLSRNGALQFRDAGLSPDSIAREVGAGTVVTGMVRSQGGQIHVDLSLADGESGAVFRRGSLERPAGDPEGLEKGLGDEVSRLLREWLGDEVTVRARRAETDDPTAWALLERGERSRKEGEGLLFGGGDRDGAEAALLQADTLAAQAEALDSAWDRPTVLRSILSRRLAQLHLRQPLDAEAFLDRGVGQADRVLARDPRNAAALESRGTLRYVRWAAGLEHDHAAAQALLASAEQDLQEAVRNDPSRADAWNILSIIHAQNDDPVESKIAARRAYEEDAYLRSADEVLWGLYTTSYDLEQFSDAVQYCREGARRFPDEARFVECELWLLASPALDHDVDRAWALYRRYLDLTPENQRAYAAARGGLLVGGVLALAQKTDSADAVFRRYRPDPSVDPARELLTVEAIFRLRMNEQDQALRLIKTYLSARPEHRKGWAQSTHWWWRPLQGNPEFQALVAGG